MSVAIVCALLALNPNPNPPSGSSDPFRGSGESASTKLNHSSSGMTLEVLQGLPRTRPVYSPPQTEIWYSQPYIAAFPGNSPGLGGYLPPGTGRSYSPLSLGFGSGWGWGWGW